MKNKQSEQRQHSFPVLIGLLILVVAIAAAVTPMRQKHVRVAEQSAVSRGMGDMMMGVPSIAPSPMMGKIIAPYPSASSPTVPRVDRKVTKNGWLNLLVEDAEQGAASIQAIAKQHDGFVNEARVYEVSEGVKAATVTIRVPAAHFETAMASIKGVAVKVENETVNATDVTEQHVDLEAQLKNLRAEETQYLEILKSAKTVEETLQVSQRLSDVRGRIESIEGQLNYLSRQVEMSTITAELTAEKQVEVLGLRWRPLVVAKQAVKTMLAGLTDFVNVLISVIIFLPVLLVWALTLGLVLYALYRIGRWIQGRYF